MIDYLHDVVKKAVYYTVEWPVSINANLLTVGNGVATDEHFLIGIHQFLETENIDVLWVFSFLKAALVVQT